MTVEQVEVLRHALTRFWELEKWKISPVTGEFPAIREALEAELEKAMGELEALNDELAKEMTEE